MRKENKQHIHPLVADRGTPLEPPITDKFGRTFNYLRLAVNEHCNLRCIYCMPEEGAPFLDQAQLLSTNEITAMCEDENQCKLSYEPCQTLV